MCRDIAAGYPIDSSGEMAEYLDMTDENLTVSHGYNLIFRKRRQACDTDLRQRDCWIMGYEKIMEHFKKRLGIEFGETTADGRFTLLPVAVLGRAMRRRR